MYNWDVPYLRLREWGIMIVFFSKQFSNQRLWFLYKSPTLFCKQGTTKHFKITKSHSAFIFCPTHPFPSHPMQFFRAFAIPQLEFIKELLNHITWIIKKTEARHCISRHGLCNRFDKNFFPGSRQSLLLTSLQFLPNSFLHLLKYNLLGSINYRWWIEISLMFLHHSYAHNQWRSQKLFATANLSTLFMNEIKWCHFIV